MMVLAMNSVSWGVRFGSRARTSWPRTLKNGGLSTSKWTSETFFSKAIPRIWFSRLMSMVRPQFVGSLCGPAAAGGFWARLR